MSSHNSTTSMLNNKPLPDFIVMSISIYLNLLPLRTSPTIKINFTALILRRTALLWKGYMTIV